MPQTLVPFFLGLTVTRLLVWFKWDCGDFTAKPIESLGLSVLVEILFLLLFAERTEAVRAAVADEKGTGDDIDDLAVLATDGTVKIHVVDLALVITDNAYLLLEGIVGFNPSANCLLQFLQGCANLCHTSQLAGLDHDHGNFLRFHILRNLGGIE